MQLIKEKWDYPAVKPSVSAQESSQHVYIYVCQHSQYKINDSLYGIFVVPGFWFSMNHLFIYWNRIRWVRESNYRGKKSASCIRSNTVTEKDYSTSLCSWLALNFTSEPSCHWISSAGRSFIKTSQRTKVNLYYCIDCNSFLSDKHFLLNLDSFAKLHHMQHCKGT